MKKKALSLFMATVMIAVTPAGTAFGSESETVQTVVVSEEDAAEDEAGVSSVSEETTASDEGAVAEKAVSVDDEGTSSGSENTASKSVGTDEAPGVSDEETAADAVGTTETEEEITRRWRR